MSLKVVLVGAGSSQFGSGTVGDIFSSATLQGAEIYLHDIDEERLRITHDKAKQFALKHELDFRISSGINRKEAFKGADFIIISIEVGDRFKLWKEDWHIPQQYGIHQVYAENGGPGGIFHSLRIIPPILDICADAMDTCPGAHLFCYSNPMTAITTTVHRAFPGISFTGLCHEISSLERYLPCIINRKFEDIDCVAGGLNHFSCLLSAYDKKTGENMYPEIMKKAYAFFSTELGYSDIWKHYQETGNIAYSEGATTRASLERKKSDFSWADRRLFKFIMENYNLLPITVDSHFGEYIAWAWDIVDHRGIIDFFHYYQTSLGSETQHEISFGCRERVIPIIEGILTNSNYLESAVNIPNRGYIDDLPEWIAVEVPGYIKQTGITGKNLGALPKGFSALLRNYCGVYDLTAEAVLKKNKDYVKQALLACPVVNSHVQDLQKMLDQMIDQQKRWLGYLI